VVDEQAKLIVFDQPRQVALRAKPWSLEQRR
jgi:hypothetical protein